MWHGVWNTAGGVTSARVWVLVWPLDYLWLWESKVGYILTLTPSVPSSVLDKCLVSELASLHACVCVELIILPQQCFAVHMWKCLRHLSTGLSYIVILNNCSSPFIINVNSPSLIMACWLYVLWHDKGIDIYSFLSFLRCVHVCAHIFLSGNSSHVFNFLPMKGGMEGGENLVNFQTFP